MLSTFRTYLNTWPARVFFLLLTSSFVLWGVTDVVRNVNHDNSVATVASRKIEMPELQEEYRRELAQVARMLGGKEEPNAEMRRRRTGGRTVGDAGRTGSARARARRRRTG